MWRFFVLQINGSRISDFCDVSPEAHFNQHTDSSRWWDFILLDVPCDDINHYNSYQRSGTTHEKTFKSTSVTLWAFLFFGDQNMAWSKRPKRYSWATIERVRWWVVVGGGGRTLPTTILRQCDATICKVLKLQERTKLYHPYWNPQFLSERLQIQ